MCPALHVALVCKFSHHLIIKYWRPYLLTSSPIYSFFSISTTCCLDLGLSLFWVIVITPDRVYLPLSMSFLFSKKKTGHQDDLFKMKVLIIRSKLCGVTTALPLGWPLSKKEKIPSVGKDVEKPEPLCTIDGNVKWYSCCGKQYDESSENYTKYYHMIQPFHFSVYTKKNYESLKQMFVLPIS